MTVFTETHKELRERAKICAAYDYAGDDSRDKQLALDITKFLGEIALADIYIGAFDVDETIYIIRLEPMGHFSMEVISP